MSKPSLLTAAAWALLSTGCAPPPLPTTDSGGPADGGLADGGAADGGTADGGTADGGAADSGTADGGSAEPGPPTMSIIFPQTREDVVICPNFVIVVDIDGLELVDYRSQPKHVEGQGHWHLYDGGDYLGAFVEPWGVVSLENDGGLDHHSLTASLSQNDHTAMGIEATVEIVVGPEGCIGGDPDPADEGDTGGR